MTSPATHARPASGTGSQSLEFDIEGMTCASCAVRVEKKLNKVDGVRASVNYATEKARIDLTGPIPVEDLIAVVEKTGEKARGPWHRSRDGHRCRH